MSELLIDVGNSAAKWAVFDGVQINSHRHSGSFAALAEVLWAETKDATSVWIASVRGEQLDQALVSELRAVGFSGVHLCDTALSEDGLLNSYKEPSRMGADRWFAMLGARVCKPGPLLVIDVGSAVTCDLVASDGRHLGGYIFPGPALMEVALQSSTRKVRYTDSLEATVTPGQSTAECVASGISVALLGAIRQVCDQYPDHQVIFTGGGAVGLAGLGLAGDLRPDLVLEGLLRRAQGSEVAFAT
ncbi:MAG: type III pantothenate kinase [Luminiphilus sp.]|nr:type III pantothenate kinase [Luminiphilus sp.]